MQDGSRSRRLIGQIIRPWIAVNRVVSLVRAWTNWHIVFGVAGWHSSFGRVLASQAGCRWFESQQGVGSPATCNVTSTSHDRPARVSAKKSCVFSAVGGWGRRPSGTISPNLTTATHARPQWDKSFFSVAPTQAKVLRELAGHRHRWDPVGYAASFSDQPAILRRSAAAAASKAAATSYPVAAAARFGVATITQPGTL